MAPWSGTTSPPRMTKLLLIEHRYQKEGGLNEDMPYSRRLNNWIQVAFKFASFHLKSQNRPPVAPIRIEEGAYAGRICCESFSSVMIYAAI